MNDPRYHRQMILPEVGEEGQRRLGLSRVLLVGCGALGCVIADLLVRAGVGRLTIVDRDVVERTNLQRQGLFDERDAREGRTKAEAAASRLAAVNSGVKIDGVVADFTSRSAEKLFDAPANERGKSIPADVLIDGTDNFLTRYLLNDLAVKRGVALVYGGAVGTTGMTMTIVPGVTPCLRCLFPEPEEGVAHETCDTAGILGPVSTIVGAMQALEVIKLLVGADDAVSRDLHEVEPWQNRSRRVSVRGARSGECVCCVKGSLEFLDGMRDREVSVICTRSGGGAVQISPPARRLGADRGSGILFDELSRRLAAQGTFTRTTSAVRGVLSHETGDGTNPVELTVFADGRAVIRGTTDTGVARAIYSRYVGD